MNILISDTLYTDYSNKLKKYSISKIYLLDFVIKAPNSENGSVYNLGSLTSAARTTVLMEGTEPRSVQITKKTAKLLCQ